jgi:hypothetical protein
MTPESLLAVSMMDVDAFTLDVFYGDVRRQILKSSVHCQ